MSAPTKRRRGTQSEAAPPSVRRQFVVIGDRGESAWASAVASALTHVSSPSLQVLGRIAPVLVDSRYQKRIDPILNGVAFARTLPVGVRYALGRRASVRGELDEARTWLTRAEAACTDATPLALRARIAFELGCVHLQGGGAETAQSIVASFRRRNTGAPPEILHLEALVAELRGERAKAIELYRASLVGGSDLTPMTKALAARNLADALAHEFPTEAHELYRRSLALLFANELDLRLEASLRNCLGYVLICLGQFDDAGAELQRARDLAAQNGRTFIQACALFNSSILHELRDEIDVAQQLLDDARKLSGRTELATWCAIRQAWVELKRGHVDLAQGFWREAGITATRAHRDALVTLEAFFTLIGGDARQAASLFGELAERYRQRSDLVTAFALLLWQAFGARRAGLLHSASRSRRLALEIERRNVIRLSPSWWAAEICTERELSSTAAQQIPTSRHVVRSPIASVTSVQVSVCGSEITIDGVAIPPTAWQQRTGSGVLRRMFRKLAAAYPMGVERNVLIDGLWAESDGDRALENLYGATKDLRRVLGGVPGLRLVRGGDVYRLEADPNVRFEGP